MLQRIINPKVYGFQTQNDKKKIMKHFLHWRCFIFSMYFTYLQIIGNYFSICWTWRICTPKSGLWSTEQRILRLECFAYWYSSGRSHPSSNGNTLMDNQLGWNHLRRYTDHRLPDSTLTDSNQEHLVLMSNWSTPTPYKPL